VTKLLDVNSSTHPRVELIVDGTASDGAYAVLDISLPGGLHVPRHVQRGQSAFAHLLDGAIELREDDKAPVVVRGGPIVVHDGRPVAFRVLRAARLVAVLVPAGAARLLPTAANRDVLADDRAALLAAAGIHALPALAGP
jgi:hypothetical protein